MTHAADRQADQTDKEIKKTYEQARKLADKVAKNRNDWCGFDLKCQLVWKGFEFNLRAFPKDLHDLYLQLAVGLGSLGWGEELLAADNLDALKQLLLRFNADESGALDLDAVRRSLLKLLDRRAEGIAGSETTDPALRITVTEERLQHVLDGHVVGGPKTAQKSLFAGDAQEVEQLIKLATSVEPTPQTGGNFQRVVDAGKVIGTDRATGLPTSTYTVITSERGELVTAFPGVP